MTWHRQVTDSGDVRVFDHTGTEVTTLTYGPGEPRRFPDDILDVMADEIDAAVAAGNIERAVAIARDGSCQQIEEGNP